MGVRCPRRTNKSRTHTSSLRLTLGPHSPTHHALALLRCRRRVPHLDPPGTGKSLLARGPLSVSVWVYFEGGVGQGGIFADWNRSLGNDLYMALVGGSVLHIRADKGSASLSADIPLGENITHSWHHLAWVMTSQSSVVYLNGKRVTEIHQPGSNKGYHGAEIGAAHRYGSFHGMLDELMVWRRALDESEVKHLAAATE
ncbi:MAG: LamG domain-containing protein [Verrucomicrobiota bacterium]